jgi:transposase-like protein
MSDACQMNQFVTNARAGVKQLREELAQVLTEPSVSSYDRGALRGRGFVTSSISAAMPAAESTPLRFDVQCPRCRSKETSVFADHLSKQDYLCHDCQCFWEAPRTLNDSEKPLPV